MQKTMTITLDEVVYDGLMNLIGREKISQFIENLARPYVEKDNLTDAYRAMSANSERENDTSKWSNGLMGGAMQEIQHEKVKSSNRRKRYSLEELFSGVTAESVSEMNTETLWAREGQAVGRELV